MNFFFSYLVHNCWPILDPQLYGFFYFTAGLSVVGYLSPIYPFPQTTGTFKCINPPWAIWIYKFVL